MHNFVLLCGVVWFGWIELSYLYCQMNFWDKGGSQTRRLAAGSFVDTKEQSYLNIRAARVTPATRASTSAVVL